MTTTSVKIDELTSATAAGLDAADLVYVADVSVAADQSNKSATLGVLHDYFGTHDTPSAGTQSVSYGFGALASVTTGQNNVAIGHDVLTALTEGSNNTAMGYDAGRALTTGGSNTLIGKECGEVLTTGETNTGVGANSLHLLVDGGTNAACGASALFSVVSGSNNAALGASSLTNVTGSNNVGVGFAAAASLTSGSGNTVLGYSSNASTAAATGQVVIGASVTGAGDNTVTIGSGSNIATLDLDGADTSWSASSDERLKKEVRGISGLAALDLVQDLQPVTYEWRTGAEVDDEELAGVYADKGDDAVCGEAGVRYAGFIAQDAEAAVNERPYVMPEGAGFIGVRDNGVYTVAPAALIPALVAAIKELTERVNEMQMALEGEI